MVNGSGGLMPCDSGGSGGLMPCGGGGFSDFMLPRRTKLFYIHINPVKDASELEERKRVIKSNEDVFQEGSISNIDFLAYLNRDENRFVRLNILTEHLFTGGKYSHKWSNGVDTYRLIEIPTFPQIEMASLMLPNIYSDISETEYPYSGDHFHDLSLDVLLKTDEVNPTERISLRIPLLLNDRRISEEHRTKQGQIFLCTYTNKGYDDRLQQKLEHLQSYSSLHSLERGLVRAIARYGGK